MSYINELYHVNVTVTLMLVWTWFCAIYYRWNSERHWRGTECYF